MLFQQIISGLALGCIYALVAIGFSLIYASFKLPHFAQGDILMLGGVFGLIVTNYIGLHFVPVIVVTILIVALVGILLDRVIYSRIVNHDIGPKIIVTVTVGILIRNLVLIIWGGRPRTFPHEGFVDFTINLGGRAFSPIYLFILIVTLILVLCLTVLLLKSKLGLGMRATAYSHELAELMGVKTKMTLLATFGLGSGLAGAGGFLIGQLIPVSFSMGVVLGMKGFVAAVIGGIGSIPGALVGGLTLGVVENLGGAYISSDYKDLIAYGIMILVLVLKPSGLLGKHTVEKV